MLRTALDQDKVQRALAQEGDIWVRSTETYCMYGQKSP